MMQDKQDERLQALTQWAYTILNESNITIRPVSGDASFRRYFRVQTSIHRYILMDAPPDKESLGPFIQVAQKLLAQGLNVPVILAEERQAGFLLLSDLGDELYLSQLNPENVNELYGDALNALIRIQGADATDLPSYDRSLLLREMNLFRDWLLPQQLGLKDTFQELEPVFELLIQAALEQPVVMVHRDYHSRNLMRLPQQNPGILDFQDAVAGPMTYDLVSLLRDCYIAWPRSQVESWVSGYFRLLKQFGILSDQYTEEQFLVWFDWMGVQRHLKASGIFARLNIRDHKPGYLRDIPRTLQYIHEVCGRYEALMSLKILLEKRVWPRLSLLEA